MKRARTHADDPLQVTRHSLVERLVNLEDQARWQEFFETYWRFIYGVARKAGLSDAEAQDVVQETVIAVARNITAYERQAGSFKSWMLQVTRWRIIDAVRKRAPVGPAKRERTRAGTATIDRLPDEAAAGLAESWEEEWQQNLLSAALERIKRKVDARHYQIFDCAVLKEWPASKVAKQLDVNIAQVYLVKHRLGTMLKREIRALDGKG